jgi:hypothetical protein
MNSTKFLDLQIARRVFGLSGIDRKSALPYSTDIDAAYSVVSKIQQHLQWACRISSRINNDGSLHYVARFYRDEGKTYAERISTTIPLAICSAALAILDEKYIEIGDNDTPDDKIAPDNIVSISGFRSSTTLTAINVEDDPFFEHMKNILSQIHWDENLDLREAADKIVDSLRKKGYVIAKCEET